MPDSDNPPPAHRRRPRSNSARLLWGLAGAALLYAALSCIESALSQ